MAQTLNLLFVSLVGFFTIIGVCEVFSAFMQWFSGLGRLKAMLVIPTGENKNIEQTVSLSKQRLSGLGECSILILDDQTDDSLSAVCKRLAEEDGVSVVSPINN